ncbi:tyrosine-type recombinase/integrase [Yersinia sp. Marseille-Q3913]|uniref:tyrosine-type recombinase/integrase n=1 Tax=Yersinia sp. Marseille-Q3913 TaxID=2830769 RepID=UPI0030D77EA4
MTAESPEQRVIAKNESVISIIRLWVSCVAVISPWRALDLTASPHSSEYCFTTIGLTNPVPLSALQEMGGWESIEMVRRYAHVSPNHLT